MQPLLPPKSISRVLPQVVQSSQLASLCLFSCSQSWCTTNECSCFSTDPVLHNQFSFPGTALSCYSPKMQCTRVGKCSCEYNMPSPVPEFTPLQTETLRLQDMDLFLFHMVVGLHSKYFLLSLHFVLFKMLPSFSLYYLDC